MQRILDPAQIEGFPHRDIPRIRVPDRSRVFARRAQRLRTLSDPAGMGRAIGDYLLLMSAVAEIQQELVLRLPVRGLEPEQIAIAHEHRMPLLHRETVLQDDAWPTLLGTICERVRAVPNVPTNVTTVCEGMQQASREALEEQVAGLLGAQNGAANVVVAARAPFLLAALQICSVNRASSLAASDVVSLDVPGVCPVCGTLPVASVVRSDSGAYGYRYLHCALCATEWHLPRITCSHCLATREVAYHTLEGGSQAVRAESCDNCQVYRKIFYQEHDTEVEPVADDLASLMLDLLLSEAGYHRGSSNPLLWQPV